MTIIEEMENVKAEVVSVKTERDELAVKITASELAVAEETAKISELESAKTVADEAQTKVIEEMAKSITERDEQIKKLSDELNDAKTKLANPAFAAVTAGDQSSVAEGGQATEKMTREEALAQYNKIDNPVEAARFRNEHRIELGLK